MEIVTVFEERTMIGLIHGNWVMARVTAYYIDRLSHLIVDCNCDYDEGGTAARESHDHVLTPAAAIRKAIAMYDAFCAESRKLYANIDGFRPYPDPDA